MSAGGENGLVEHAVLMAILELHPEHLTASELVLKVAGEGGQAEREEIRQAIRDLRGSSLLRYTGDVVEPTHAAVRAGEVFAWS
jgi:hypothetical protein